MKNAKVRKTKNLKVDLSKYNSQKSFKMGRDRVYQLTKE